MEAPPSAAQGGYAIDLNACPWTTLGCADIVGIVQNGNTSGFDRVRYDPTHEWYLISTGNRSGDYSFGKAAFSLPSTTQLVSSLPTGTAPFSIFSTTPVANLVAGGNMVALSGVTGSIGGSALTLGQQATGPVAISGASSAVAAGATVSVTPVTSGNPGNGFIWQGYISATDTVTVQVICLVAGTPTATTYNVRVIK
jgi:hypothetical protein